MDPSPTPLVAPKRRSLSAMKKRLELLQPGDLISVLFKEERYGTYRVTGPAVRSSVTGDWHVGGIRFDSFEATSPRGKVMQLAVGDDAKASQCLTDGLATPSRARHGRLLQAVFDRSPWGRFTVAGHVVTDTEWRMAAIGTHIVTARRQLAPGLHRVYRLHPATEADPPPPIVDVWDRSESIDGWNA